MKGGIRFRGVAVVSSNTFRILIPSSHPGHPVTASTDIFVYRNAKIRKKNEKKNLHSRRAHTPRRCPLWFLLAFALLETDPGEVIYWRMLHNRVLKKIFTYIVAGYCCLLYTATTHIFLQTISYEQHGIPLQTANFGFVKRHLLSFEVVAGVVITHPSIRTRDILKRAWLNNKSSNEHTEVK